MVRPWGEWSERDRSRAIGARLLAPELFLQFWPVPGRQEDFLRLARPKDHPVRSLVQTTPPRASRDGLQVRIEDRVMDRGVMGVCPGVSDPGEVIWLGDAP